MSSSKTSVKTTARKPNPTRIVRPGARSLLRPELFFPDLEAQTLEELFATLVGALADLGVAQHREALLDALLERERLGTTALGRGAAVPHARSMVVGESAAVFARTRRGIDFAAPDGDPVRLVFLIVAPYGASGAAYLPLVAAAARAVQEELKRSRLLELQTFEELDRLVKPATMVEEAYAR
jgi:mannitol/fructose-specific phosphotransferase system IIA component (Ntr-type)